MSVRLAEPDRARIVEAAVDGRPLVNGDLPAPDTLAVDTASLPDGEHLVSVVAEDASWRKNRATAAWTVRSDNTPPRLQLEARPEQVEAGRTLLLRVRADEPATIQASLGGRPLGVQATDGFGWAILGFGPDAQPASLPLVVDGTDRVGNRAEQQAVVQLATGSFPLDRVEVEPSLVPLLGPDVRAEEDRRLAPTYARVTPRLWEGRFVVPVQGPIITQFGEQRSYNGGPVVGHHAGVDFAVPSGTRVLAPARGRIVLVDEVRLRGRIVVLDHGLGVFTTYGHLSGVDAEIGQVLERGQPFARVGSTGLSTGPHLHWELWVGGANVSPLEWTERDLP